MLREGLTQFQNYSWRLLAEFRVRGGARTGPAASGPGRRPRHRPCPAPPRLTPAGVRCHRVPLPGSRNPDTGLFV